MDPVCLIAASSALSLSAACHHFGMGAAMIKPAATSTSLEPEFAADRTEVGRADQVLMSDHDAEQLAVEPGLPEGEELVELGKRGARS